MKYKIRLNWHESENIVKIRMASYFSKLLFYVYSKPLESTGKVLGIMLGKMPILLSSSLKQTMRLTTSMPLSLDIKVVVDRMSDYKRAQFCNKERQTCEWIEKFYKKGDTVYDIGANIGAVSLVSAAHLEKECLVYSFEPLPSSFNMLFKNIMINNFDKVIIPLNMALSNKVEIKTFYLTSIESGSSGHSVNKGDLPRELKKSMTVLTNTLDNLVNSYCIKRADHIKIDVDGIDYEVLLGGEKNILNDSTLKTILIEKNGKEGKIRDLVKKYGFVEVEFRGYKGKYENIGFVRDASSSK
jgi:FkbM family methyltransferase